MNAPDFPPSGPELRLLVRFALLGAVLRRPLTLLRMNIDILNDPALPPDGREACLSDISSEAQTIRRLLLLSRERVQAFDADLV